MIPLSGGGSGMNFWPNTGQKVSPWNQFYVALHKRATTPNFSPFWF